MVSATIPRISRGTPGNIDVHAGVDLNWTTAQLEGTVRQIDLLGGAITVHRQGLLHADGRVRLVAGGDITLDADALINTDRDITRQDIILVPETITKIDGYTKVAAGTVTVPEITYVPTIIISVTSYFTSFSI